MSKKNKDTAPQQPGEAAAAEAEEVRAAGETPVEAAPNPRLEELAREEQRAACRILLQRADWDGADLAFTLCRL